MSNTVIAKNALFLYVRTIFTIIISLYSSRVLLKTLGVDDFGLYNLIGGIVAIFTSLRIFLSNAIQRFINYERGQGNVDKVSIIFNIGLYIHRWVALIFFILCEVVGAFLISNLNIEPDRLTAAYITFQLSIFTTVIYILTIPYDALVIANEKMDFYATLSVIESLLKLMIIYLISVMSYDKLVSYACLLFAVSALVRVVNIVYCKISFAESHARKCRDKGLMKSMMTFAGWNICGNLGYSLTHEGVNFVLNLFGGVVVNAAKGITYQIISSVNTLIGNISIAFKPQINTAYGSGDKHQFYHLLTYNGKILFASYVIVAVPLFIFVPQILHMWLGTVPQYTVAFVRSLIFYGLVRSLHAVINSFYDSIGQMKYYQICELCYMVTNIPIAYVLLSMKLPYWSVFISMGIVESLNLMSIIFIATKLYDFDYRIYIKAVIFPCIKLIVFGGGVISVLLPVADKIDNFWQVLGLCGLLVLVILSCVYNVVLDRHERYFVKDHLLKKLRGR